MRSMGILSRSISISASVGQRLEARLARRFASASVRRAILDAVEPRRLMAAISGTVFNDANANGWRDSVESGVAGQIIFVDYNYNRLQDPGEPSAYTDSVGAYSLNTTNAAFDLRVKPGAGYQQTAPMNDQPRWANWNGTVTGQDFGLVVIAGVNVTPVPFIDYDINGTLDPTVDASEVFGFVNLWLDTNKDGRKQSGELAFRAASESPQTGVPSKFTYTPIELAPGTYRIAGRLLNDRDDVADGYVDITITANSGPLNVQIPLVGTTRTFSGSIYNDLNRNGSRDSGEPGIGGVTVWHDRDRDGVVDSGESKAISASDGTYNLDLVYQAGGQMRALAPAGYVQTDPSSDNGIAIFVTGDVGGFRYAFATQPTSSSVSGRVFNDLDNDNYQDQNETGIADQTVWADYNYNHVRDANEPATLTDANGRYTLLVNTTHFDLRITPISGFTQTSPFNGQPHWVNLTSAATLTGRDFGVHATAPTGHGVIQFGFFADYDADGIASEKDANLPPDYNFGAFIDSNYNGLLDAGEQKAITFGGKYGITSIGFDNLADGTYHVVFVRDLPAGQYVVGGITRDLSVLGGYSSNFSVPIAGYPKARIDGLAFVDTNANGYQESDEPGQWVLDNYTIYIDANFNGTLDATEERRSLDFLGFGDFDLLPGSYSFRMNDAAGKPVTFAYGATSRWVTISKPGLNAVQFGVVNK